MRIYEDLRVVQARIGVLQYLVLASVGAVVVWFWYLQVLHGRYYRDLADNNRSRTIRVAAPRGPLLDRNGQVLVGNRPAFNVVVTPEHAEDLDETVARLARLLNVGESQIRERLARRLPFRPVLVKADADFAAVAALEARRLELPEVQVEAVPLRSYPLAAAAAHTLGRVGEVTDRQLQAQQFPDVAPGDLVGQAGIESEYNAALMGRNGARRVIVDSRGLEVGEAEADRVDPLDGHSLTLTLDADLQKAMEQAFGGRAGSGVALDPRTGEILAMTSTPAYDPNEFTTGIDAALWNSLAGDPRTPLMNRVIQAQYAPGSLFKVVMATAALEEGVITPQTTFYCPGYLSIYNTMFRCHRASGHGVMNLRQAIAQSCNVYFYQVGVALEIARIARWAKRLGLGAVTGVDLPHEATGLVPSPEWKQATQHAAWYAGETVSVAIGQGQVTVTPLQMARLAAAIATGKLVRPHLVKAVAGKPVAWPAPVDLGLKPQTLAAVRDGMWSVVNDQGTGWRARLPGIAVCGKTGSAQVVAHARLQRAGSAQAMLPHGWFIGFAPEDDPVIALAIIVEHGGSGGEAAAPVAHEVLSRFFSSRPAQVAGSGPVDTEG